MDENALVEIAEKIKGIHLSTDYMSVRLYNSLKRAGYEYLIDVIALDNDDLISIRSMGKHSIDEVMTIKSFIYQFPTMRIRAETVDEVII